MIYIKYLGVSMKISVEEFMRQEAGAGKKSRLDPYEHEILTLKSNGYSYEQIIKFLSQNDIEISKTALHHFVKSRNADKPAAVSEIRNQPANDSVQTENRQTDTVAPAVPSKKQTEPEKTRPIIGKFDLNREINVEELM